MKRPAGKGRMISLKKRICLSSLGFLLLSVLLAGCKSEEQAAADTQVSEEAAPKEILEINPLTSGKKEGSGEASPATGNETPMVGIVTYEGGIEDGSFNQSAWEGLTRLSGSIDCDTRFLESRAEGDFRAHVNSLVDQGCDLCWGIGYSCSDDLLSEAEAHPEVAFAIVDYAYPETPDNMTGVMFRAEEPSFLAGYIAGKVTETGKIGFVGGENTEVVGQFLYGFQAGAACAGSEKETSIEVISSYADSFSDPEKGKSIAEELYGRGCDIIFHAAGETGLGVIDAAKETGNYVIGVDKDQSYLAPDRVLTSVIKNVNSAVFQVSKEYLTGEKIGGNTINLGLSEDAVGISEEHDLYPEEVYEEMLKLKEEIISGSLTVPATEDACREYIEQLGH